MNITVRALTESKEILNACRVTVWKGSLDKEPSEAFLDEIYMSEHSPIRDKWFVIEIEGIKSWVATHFARHHVGMTPYVATQRDDRNDRDVSRDDIGQGALVNMRMTINAQGLIDMSRKRLCGQASLETRQVMNTIVNKLSNIEPHLVNKCVPNCVYRGFCPEKYKCDFNLNALKKWRKNYLNGRDNLDDNA